MPQSPDEIRAIEVLLVEDNPDDVRLTIEALRDGKVANRLNVVRDGLQALRYLRRESPFLDAKRPDLVLLDLNLPLKDGREVLAEMRADPALCTIPIAIVTGSRDSRDREEAGRLDAEYYVTKPITIEQLAQIVRQASDFWISIVKLPGGSMVCAAPTTTLA
jgi:CheY-like chemotaxis protein